MTAMEWLLALAVAVAAWWLLAAAADTRIGRRATDWTGQTAAFWIATHALAAWHWAHPPQPPEESAP